MILYETDACEKFIFGIENVHSKNLERFVFLFISDNDWPFAFHV